MPPFTEAGGGKIAEYLSRGDEKSAVLESLVQEVSAPAAEASAPAPAESETQREENVGKKLEQLTEEPKPVVPEPEKAEVKEDQNLREADARLNDILGNRK